MAAIEASLEELNAALELQKDFWRRYGKELDRLREIYRSCDHDLLTWELDEDPVMHCSLDRPWINYFVMLDRLDGDSIMARLDEAAPVLAAMAVAQGIEPIPGIHTYSEDEDKSPF